MKYKLSKVKKNKLKITTISAEFEDTFSTIHIGEFYLKKYGIKPPCTIDKDLQPVTFSELTSLITRVNLFKPRDEVPNKRVVSDVPGTSKLIRSKDKTKIEICYRVINKSGKQERCSTSNNTCYINLAQRELFFEHSKQSGSPYRDRFGKDHYFIEYGDHNFQYWSDLMDKEYARLAGFKYRKKEKPKAPAKTAIWTERFDRCLDAYSYTDLGTDLNILRALEQEGLAKLNNLQTALYNKHGYWICDLEEFLEKDRNAFMISSIAHWLTESELLTAKRVIEKFIPDFLSDVEGVDPYGLYN